MKFCKKCNLETRRSNDGKCLSCKKAYNAEYRAKNRDKINAQKMEHYAANAERLRLCAAEYRKSNPDVAASYKRRNAEYIKMRRAQYYQLNIETLRAKGRVADAIYHVRSRHVRDKYRNDNRAAMNKKSAEYHAKNCERIRESKIKWRDNNLDYVRAYRIKYQLEHKQQGREWARTRRARKVNNGGVLSIGVESKLFAFQNGKCACCGKPLGNSYHLDHVIPLVRGGGNNDDNVQLLLQRCNNQKGGLDPFEFMMRRRAEHVDIWASNFERWIAEITA